MEPMDGYSPLKLVILTFQNETKSLKLFYTTSANHILKTCVLGVETQFQSLLAFGLNGTCLS